MTIVVSPKSRFGLVASGTVSFIVIVVGIRLAPGVATVALFFVISDMWGVAR